jgi:DNA-binding beta-propeller fold protein YncE
MDAARSEDQFRMGVQAFHRGLFTEAVVSFEKAITLQPANSRAQYWLGRTLARAGYEPQALRTWESLAKSGYGGALLRDQAQVLRTRTGLGRELARSGTFVVSAELSGNARGGHPFRRPTAVRPRADGSFFVAAFGSNEILLYDANFRLRAVLKGGLEGLDKPWDVLESPDGTLFVSEYGANRIAKCRPNGDKVAVIGKKGTADGELLGPQYLAGDGRGYLYVTDWGNSRVVKFNTDGGWVSSFRGLAGPTGIAVRDGLLYVSERTAKRISVFDLSGNRLGSLGEGTLEAPEGLALSATGTLLVADGLLVRECDVEKESWSVRGDASASASRLVHQAVTANGDILCADFDDSSVFLLTDSSALYGGLVARVQRVNSARFPEVFVEVAVETKLGSPVVGLEINNFIFTESRFGVGETTLVQSNTASAVLDAVLLVERSPAFEKSRAEAAAVIGELRELVAAGGRAAAVSAGEKPSREAEFGEARLRMVEQALQAPVSSGWRLDEGARLAGDLLAQATSTSRKAIFFLGSGSLGPAAFRTYSTAEIAAFMRSNAIAFYPVVFGTGSVDGDLAWLAAETGGRVFSSAHAGGMPAVVAAARARVSSSYTVRYLSRSDAKFGEKFIPLEVEVTLQKVSGRDEAGYYAPPSD